MNRKLWVAFLLLLVPLTGFAATKTWTGGGGNQLWSNPANWSGGAIPMNGDDVFVTNSTTNDLSGLFLNSLSISGSGTLDGNQVTLGAGLVNVSLHLTVSSYTVAIPIQVSGEQLWKLTAATCGATVTFSGDITGTGNVDFYTDDNNADVTTTITGHLDNNGQAGFSGGKVILKNTNHFTGHMAFTGSGRNVCGTFTPDMTDVTIAAAGAIPTGTTLDFLMIRATTLHFGPYSASVAAVTGTGNIDFAGANLMITEGSRLAYQGAFTGNGTVTVTGGMQTVSDPPGGYGNPTSNLTGVVNVSGGTLLVQQGTIPTPTSVAAATLELNLGGVGNLTVTGGTLELMVQPPNNYYAGSDAKPNTAGSVALNSSSTFEAYLSYTSVHEYLDASGNVSLGNSMLVVQPATTTKPGETHTLIKNNSGNPVSGMFAGLPEGATFTQSGLLYRITYQGGTSGHDVVLTVLPTPTQTSLNAAPNPANAGQTVTLTATATSTGGTPSGNVAFFDGSTQLGTSSLDGTGHATFTTSWSAGGSHSLTATYSGNATFASNAVTEVVNPAATTTSLRSSLNPSSPGQLVTFTANVTSTPVSPSGTVTFFEGNATIGSAPLDQNGNAAVATSSLAQGSHTITAQFAGTNFQSSTSPALTQIVNASSTTPTTITISSTPNESNSSQQVEFTAVVTATSGGTPQGTVTFNDNGMMIGSATIDGSGRAAFDTSALAPGAHTITAVYAGNGTFGASNSPAIVQIVDGTSTCAPSILVAPDDTRVLPHTTVSLSGTTSGDQSQSTQWFWGTYPDASRPATSSSSLIVSDAMHSTNAWVLITSACGATHAQASVILVPPKHRATGH